MKIFPATLLVLFALGTTTFADVPKPAPITRYTGLWTNSPFTSKPPPPPPAETVNPLDDYALAGVSPITGGYRVTMLNKKNPDERITVDSNGSQSNGYKILAVTRKPGDPLGTVVRMSMGAVTGTVTFDENLLVLKAPPPPQVQQQAQPGVNPANLPQVQQQAAQPGQRQPRPRVVPPPNVQGGAAVQQRGVNSRGQQGTTQGQQQRRPDRGRR